MAQFAEVALNIPVDKTFQYSVPPTLQDEVKIGKRIRIPFGKRSEIGFVVGLSESSNIKNIKSIEKVLDKNPIIEEKMLKLSKWISEYYCSPLGFAVRLCVPSYLNKDEEKKREVNKEELDFNAFGEAKIILNKEQKRVIEKIKEGIKDFNVFLLHGITASGKTEVYLKASEMAIDSGSDVIVLVPEISLTPQTAERFQNRFKDKVAIMHSRLSAGKRFLEWKRCRDGNAKVVIGARSALFAPFKNVGLIIVDEEHETSYKEITAPKYNTRDVAIKRAEIEGCPVILGSATPSLESYYKAKKGKFVLLELKERVEKRLLPKVKIVDMKEEFAFKRESLLFSRALLRELKSAIEKKEQTILFLNRRGFSTFINCRACGFVMKCKRCDSVMVYHTSGGNIICHHCNFKMPLPEFCPKCRSKQLKFFGVGTERVESEIHRLFPNARIARLDTDVTKKKGSHEKVLLSFKRHEIDILIGTQMIAKGLDFPSVTLIGVISSDINLNLPDFRASERTFNLLTQVAGRSGRGKKQGFVIIQTYSPKHYSIILSSKHDYESFYESEIKFRQDLNLPPFTNLIKISLSASKESVAMDSAGKLKDLIRKEIGLKENEFMGPAPNSIARVKNKFIWNLFLKIKDVLKVSGSLRKILGGSKIFEKAYLNIDVDPI